LGLNWQITPRTLMDGITGPDRAPAKRAFEAIMTMRKSTSLRSKRRGEAKPAGLIILLNVSSMDTWK